MQNWVGCPSRITDPSANWNPRKKRDETQLSLGWKGGGRGIGDHSIPSLSLTAALTYSNSGRLLPSHLLPSPLLTLLLHYLLCFTMCFGRGGEQCSGSLHFTCSLALSDRLESMRNGESADQWKHTHCELADNLRGTVGEFEIGATIFNQHFLSSDWSPNPPLNPWNDHHPSYFVLFCRLCCNTAGGSKVKDHEQ